MENKKYSSLPGKIDAFWYCRNLENMSIFAMKKFNDEKLPKIYQNNSKILNIVLTQWIEVSFGLLSLVRINESWVLLSLLKLEEALEYNQYIQPIDFPDGYEPRDGERCHLTGWRYTSPKIEHARNQMAHSIWLAWALLVSQTVRNMNILNTRMTSL